MTNLPNRSSDAGPEETSPRDWYEWLCEAEELIAQAKIMPDMRRIPHAERVAKINDAVMALAEAIELLTPESLAECELASQEAAQLVTTLAQAGLTPEQARALGKVVN